MRGNIYILANDAMRGLFKVGCTINAPAHRAAQLSGASGVPAPFRVLCYAELDSFQRREKELHRFLARMRPNPGREFFKGPMALKEAASWLYHHPHRRSFETVAADLLTAPYLLGGYRFASLDETLNPWKAVL